MTTNTTSQTFFEEKYKHNPDPWAFASSAYELNRYDATIAALQQRRYQRAFEPGCSVGVLTARLATLCDHVDAIDISPTAVERARERCRGFDNVTLTCGALPDAMSHKQFDLLVFSEIGYYFEEALLISLADQLIRQLAPSGTLLAVHWLGTSPDHILSGDRVHELLAELPGLRLDHAERHKEFRLDRWTKL